MNIFIDRKETPTSVIYVYKSTAAFYMLFFVSLVLIFVERYHPILGILSNIATALFVIFSIGFFITTRTASKEIRSIMKKEKVKMSGSKFSFSNPMTIEIEK